MTKIIRLGGLYDTEKRLKDRGAIFDPLGLSPTLTCAGGGYGMPLITDKEKSMLRIRKLTPKECMRLMGFTDDDYQALKDIGLSDSAIYHCAGDSIITTCLVGIISPLVNNDDTHINIINEYVERRIIQQ